MVEGELNAAIDPRREPPLRIGVLDDPAADEHYLVVTWFHPLMDPRGSQNLLGHLARADGSYGRLLGKLARMDVLILDDWGLAPVQDQERRDLLEILEDRYGSRSTIVTSQLPPGQWHDHLGEPTLADAICDRLLHNAHRLVLKGPSRRKEGKLSRPASLRSDRDRRSARSR